MTPSAKTMFLGVVTAMMALVGLGLARNVVKAPAKELWHVGRWRLVDDEGRTSSWLVILPEKAQRGHSDLVCVPECLEAEVRLAWPDGFRDVLKIELDGSVKFLALPRWAKSWDEEPRFVLTAEKR